MRCSELGCEKDGHSKGLCQYHYQRQWLTKKKTGNIRRRATVESAVTRFFKRYTINENKCWIWSGKKDPAGYGVMSVLGEPVRMHRFSFKIHHGEIPEGAFILHSCDQRACVNPAHLRAGSHIENMADARQRGRMHNRERKLTASDVKEIRRLRLVRKNTYGFIASVFGVNRATIREAALGITYRDIPDYLTLIKTSA